jgi:hypothetical protein
VIRTRTLFYLASALLIASAAPAQRSARPSRLVVLKVDGLSDDLLERSMKTMDPATGRSRLPWLTHIFAENGTIFDNFYTRGISLSAPSWSMLDTGRHTVIRGNVEYDRYTGQVYDYLNFFPFYIGYARLKEVDMPGVKVLDRAGIPLLIDRFPYAERLQSFQLFQRGVRWTTLQDALKRRFSAEAIVSMVESGDAPSYDSVLARATEAELENNLAKPEIFYLDFFTGDIDHEGHATSQPEALQAALQSLDALAGRIWTGIQKSPLSTETLFVMVSDHGMNNVPGIISQTFSLPDLLNSPEGGSHHVVTNRHQMSDFKLKGLDPLVQRVISPSTTSFYLATEASHYPTAWLDLDGNERAAIHFRNNDWNKLHILLLALAQPNLDPAIRKAAAMAVRKIVARRRAAWTNTADAMTEELSALEQAIAQRKLLVANLPKRFWKSEQRESGEDKATLRLRAELDDWRNEDSAYTNYVAHLRRLLALQPDDQERFKEKIEDFLPEMSLGDSNSVADLQHYAVGPAAGGLAVDANGRLDEEHSFRFVNYFELFARQRARNVPQKELSARPIDFTAMRLRLDGPRQGYWLYGDAEHQLVMLTDADGRIEVKPVRNLIGDADGKASWAEQPWRTGLPLALFEDPELQLPPGVSRAAWLSAWHTEREWLEAIHRCRYSNGVIGITEELSPVAENVPGPPGISPILMRYERRRRELVQADLHVFASDHWNFNVRFPNPGGNHGSFLRISTHAVWMMAGGDVPVGRVEEPYDSLNFASTLLALLGRKAPMPDRVVHASDLNARQKASTTSVGRSLGAPASGNLRMWKYNIGPSRSPAPRT